MFVQSDMCLAIPFFTTLSAIVDPTGLFWLHHFHFWPSRVHRNFGMLLCCGIRKQPQPPPSLLTICHSISFRESTDVVALGDCHPERIEAILVHNLARIVLAILPALNLLSRKSRNTTARLRIRQALATSLWHLCKTVSPCLGVVPTKTAG